MAQGHLESLPAEVLVMILSAASSTEDALSLICSSRVFHDVFLPVKKTVLLSIAANDLGSGVRDAIAAIRIFPSEIKNWDAALLAIKLYEALPPGLDSAANLNVDEAVQIVRLNRSVQFLVDEYVKSTFPELHVIHPDSTGPLTPTERARIARAMMRHQILTCLEVWGIPVARKLYELFKPWEMQQLADIGPLLRNRVTFATQHVFYSERGMCIRPYVMEKSRKMKAEAMRDLIRLHREIVAEWKREHKSPRYRYQEPQEMYFGGSFIVLMSGPLPDETSSDRVAEEHRGLRDELHHKEDALPRLLFHDNDNDHNADAPPFAWIDGHDGLDCQRWGRHVHRELVNDPSPAQSTWRSATLSEWRCMGLVFWDRPRIELLKSNMPKFATGWLRAPLPSDEECRAYKTRYMLPHVENPGQ